MHLLMGAAQSKLPRGVLDVPIERREGRIDQFGHLHSNRSLAVQPRPHMLRLSRTDEFLGARLSMSRNP